MTRTSLLITAAALIALAALPASAAEYYVDGQTGSDANDGTDEFPWRTLDKANAALMPGDTCYVLARLYENSQIAPARSGAEGAPITYRGRIADAQERPEITGGKYGSIVSLHDRSWVRVEEFRIHSPTEHDWVVRISGENAHHNEIVNCEITDPEGYAPVVIANGAHHNTIADCYIHDTGHGEEGSGDCIVLNYGAHHNTITRNRCANACHSQIMALNGSHHNTISHNALYATRRDWAGAGVNLPLGADSNTVVGNVIFDLGYITDQKCAIQIDSADNVIRNNTIADCGAFGIALQSYTYGSNRQEATGNLVANNTIYNTGRQGLTFVSKRDCVSRDNRIVNNIVVGSPADWYGVDAWIMIFDTYHLDDKAEPGDWFGNVFEHNLFFHRVPGEPNMVLYNHRGAPVTWPLAELEAAYPQTFRGNIEADPEFRFAGDHVVGLQPTSPALDAGLDLGYPFHGKAPDLGAIETAPGPAE